MLSNIPVEVRESVVIALSKFSGSEINLIDFEYSSGGCINSGGRLSTNAGSYFLKWNNARKYPGMFKAESRGLQLLFDSAAIKVPKVIAAGEASDVQFLLLEFIDGNAKQKNFWETLGLRLSELHQHTSDKFGLNHDNYIGSLPQQNATQKTWTEFFIHQRIDPLLKLTVNRKIISPQHIKDFEQLYTKFSAIFPETKPSLLHGDLWIGNLMTDAAGYPALIDPAVYYGHPEMDLAFTMLFGGFDHKFYQSYHEAQKPAPGFEQRAELYNLYPLMVHALLFGGSYISQCLQIVSRYK